MPVRPAAAASSGRTPQARVRRQRNVVALVVEGAGKAAGRLHAKHILGGLTFAVLLRVRKPADDQIPYLVEFNVRRLAATRTPRASERGLPRFRRAGEEDNDALRALHLPTVGHRAKSPVATLRGHSRSLAQASVLPRRLRPLVWPP
jgi:hypothetical protein